MIEDEVHLLSRKWLESNGYSYKGVCNEGTGKGGHVPVPTVTDNEKVLIDNQGEKRVDGEPTRIWIEDKGSNAGLSTLLEGFSRTVYAVYYGGGDGLLSIPSDRIPTIEENTDFFEKMARVTVGKGRIGVLDAEKQSVKWF